MGYSQHNHQTPFWKSSAGLAFLVVTMVVSFYLVTEHQAHLYGVLPYLLLLACPVIHILMHRGHNHGDNPGNSERSRRDKISVEGREGE